MTHFFIGVREIDALSGASPVRLASFSSPVAVDLLQYQHGNALEVAGLPIPAQSYSQLRLVLDESATTVTFADGTTLPAVFKTHDASSSSSGAGSTTVTAVDPVIPRAVDVTMDAPFTEEPGGRVALIADFNVLESVARTNPSFVTVRPVLFGGDGAGRISGMVRSGNGTPVRNAVVAAIAPDGSVGNTAVSGENGAFDLHALEAGNYRLVIYNTYTNAAGQTIAASGQDTASPSFTGPAITLRPGGSASVEISD